MPLQFATFIRVTTVDKLARALDMSSSWVEEEATSRIERWVQVMRDRAKERAPVRTGWLRSNITYYALGFLTFGLANPVCYSGFVEFGTSRMAAQPHMRPAIEMTVPEMLQDVRDGLVNRLVTEVW